MNADERGYNGWANYETWNVVLWLENDEGLYDMLQSLPTKTAASIHELCAEIWPDVENEPGQVIALGCTPDRVAVDDDRIDWHEIAEHYGDDEDAED
jgi:hypothetical protein